MPDTVSSISRAGFATENHIGEHTITVDSREERGPNPTATLLASYASCFVVGLRIAASEEGFDDLGTVQIDVTGTRDDSNDLDGVAFDLAIEHYPGDEAADEVVDRALRTCHVGTALREELEADVTVHPKGED
ncbi:MAG: OsmC family protein [Halodesulfurarchaeum sp.]